MAWRNSLVLAALALSQVTAMGQNADLPPPFPRPGTTQILQNEAVAVWNVSWLKQQYPLHTHRYDLIGISYTEGQRIITQGEQPGRLTNTRAWEFQRNEANVTHVEEGASEPPLRAVLIEVKRAAPAGVAVGDGPDGLVQVAGTPSWRNKRADGWIVMPGAKFAKHRHTGDAIELVFDGTMSPKATFVPAGTTHDGPAAPEGGRAVIFELK